MEFGLSESQRLFEDTLGGFLAEQLSMEVRRGGGRRDPRGRGSRGPVRHDGKLQP
ncbi:MAG: hypothetical protein AVDCRST_MAG08-1138 [uncultured Acetobacteraceae bacterium]|uniref:Uncharacterized protein n=1 Tax=uncultured Acetobacteraceae bacterium TaxID=169975 RepID=A0A6J4HTP0_9PROT|nr:MAG: hypothetical protein AVDCRST_MAG08-1138 [uncultured Acetobacteraceae bacterium]